MNYLRPAIIGLLALAVLLLATLLESRWDEAGASSFTPSSTFSASDSTPGENANIGATFTIPAPDANVEILLLFTPAVWGVAADAAVPDGALVAEVATAVTLGIINGACENVLPIGLDMMDATAIKSATIPFSDPEVTIPCCRIR